jgi:hypothetical protein
LTIETAHSEETMSASEIKIKITKVAGDEQSDEELGALIESTSPLIIEGTVSDPSHAVTCNLRKDGALVDTKAGTVGRNNTWSVDFGQRPSGYYTIDASAPGEGAVTLSVTIQ